MIIIIIIIVITILLHVHSYVNNCIVIESQISKKKEKANFKLIYQKVMLRDILFLYCFIHLSKRRVFILCLILIIMIIKISTIFIQDSLYSKDNTAITKGLENVSRFHISNAGDCFYFLF